MKTNLLQTEDEGLGTLNLVNLPSLTHRLLDDVTIIIIILFKKTKTIIYIYISDHEPIFTTSGYTNNGTADVSACANSSMHIEWIFILTKLLYWLESIILYNCTDKCLCKLNCAESKKP